MSAVETGVSCWATIGQSTITTESNKTLCMDDCLRFIVLIIRILPNQ